MPSYKTQFRKIALLADKIDVGGPAEKAHPKRVRTMGDFLTELEQFTDRYRETLRDIPQSRVKQPDGSLNISTPPEIMWFRDQFLLHLETFAYKTHCNSSDVMAALTLDYEEIHTDIKHFPNIVDDSLHLDILQDLAEETASYLEMLETGKRRTHTPISKYLDEISKCSPYPKSYAPGAELK